MAEAELAQQLAQIETMTNVELRAELKRHGCSTTGVKKDLLAKLRAALQKEYQQNLQANAHSVGYTQNEAANLAVPDQQSSLNNVPIPQNVHRSPTPTIPIPQQLSISPVIEPTPIVETTTPTKKSRPTTRSKTLSVDSPSQPTAPQAPIVNTEAVGLDLSTNNANVEVTSFVSKTSEENEREKTELGGESHLSSLDSSSAMSESIVQEKPLFDEQQRLNQGNSLQIENPPLTTEPDSARKNDPSAEIPQEEKQPVSIAEHVPSERILKVDRAPPTTPSFMKTSNRSTAQKINLSTDFLKTLIPDLSLVSESAANDDLDAYINEQTSHEGTSDTGGGNEGLPTHSMTIGELADQKHSTNRTVVVDITNESSLNDHVNGRKSQYLTSGRAPSFESKTVFEGKTNTVVTDEPVRIKEASATHEPPSRILYIRGLTRPFSLFQLKGLLARYGTLVDGEFWLDKIKSQCFVTYTSIEEAQEARQALDGCRWPSTNPKTLSIRFGRQDELDFSKTRDLPPDEMSIDSIDLSKQEKSNVASSHQPTSPTNGIKAKRSDVREWDKDKQSGFLIPDEEEGPEKEHEEVKANEAPGKGLDDYFRKTKAKPSVYWLPLTEEQIMERTRRQEQRKAERDEEQRKRDLDGNSRRSDSKSNRRSSSREKRKHSSSPPRRNAKRH